jgi:hypothetical protein
MKYALLLTVFATQIFAGPFGFEKGMTRQQILDMVGSRAVVKDTPGDYVIRLSTAPKPHPAFEEYSICFDLQGRLAKIVATGKTIQTNRYGYELKREFESLSKQLETAYGPPSHTFDFLSAGSIWNEPQDWMMGLDKKERRLETYWCTRPITTSTRPVALPNGLTLVTVEAEGLSSHSGYLSVVYEFDGWNQAVDQRQNAEASTLR